MTRKALKVVVLSLPGFLIFSILLGTGLWGLDFGFHWDEKKLFFQVGKSLDSLTLLPQQYNYPSFSYWLTLSATIPHLFGAVQKLGYTIPPIRQHLLIVLESPAYLLQVRQIFLFLTSLSVLWVYYTSLVAWKRHWLEAFVAAAAIGFSWEVAYHSRWIAPDGILMQFSALTLFGVVMAIKNPSKPSWLVVAAIAAGLGTGTKYQGVLLMIPVLTAAYIISRENGGIRKLVPITLVILTLFGISYLFSTPGTILDPLRFFRDVVYELQHYQSDHYGQFIQPGLPHFWLILRYFTQVFFSHFQPIAILFLFLFLLGAYDLINENIAEAIVILSFPVLYLLFFSLQRVFIARNLLVVAPFLAILVGRGSYFVWDLLHNWRFRWLWMALITTALLVNASWLIYSANTITDRKTDRFIRELATYIDNHPQTSYFVSDRVTQDLQSLDTTEHKNIVKTSFDQADFVILYASEGFSSKIEWPRNKPGLTSRVFGTWEVNFDYYPTWSGDDRIVLLPMDKAIKIGVLVIE